MAHPIENIFLHQGITGKAPWWKTNRNQLMFRQVDLTSLKRQVKLFKKATEIGLKEDLKHKNSAYIKTMSMMVRCGAVPEPVLSRVNRVISSIEELCTDKTDEGVENFIANQLKANIQRDRYTTLWLNIFNKEFD